MSASFTLQIQQNYRSNEMTAVIVGNNGAELDSIAEYFLVKVTNSSETQTTIYQTTLQATNQNEESVPLGNAYTSGTEYTITSIALDASYTAVANESESETVTFYDAPNDPSGNLSLSSSSGQLLASMVNVDSLDITGAPVTHFYVEGVQLSGAANGGSGLFSKTVARTAGATTVLIAANDNTYASFLNGQQWSVNVTAFNVAGSSGPESDSAFITATPNAFALVVTQPVDPTSAPAFTFAATDSNPIPATAITGLSLVVAQGSNSATLDLFNTYSSNWDASNSIFSALTINTSVLGYTLTTADAVTLSFRPSNQFGNGTSQTEFTYNGSANTSTFTPQTQATFNAAVTASNLAAALIDKDIINDNVVSTNLNNSSALSALGSLAGLYDANASTVSLVLEPVDANGSAINSQSATLTALDQDVSFNLGQQYSQIALKLTMSSAYDNGNSNTRSVTSDLVDLITTQLAISSLSVAQPSSGSNSVVATLTVDATDANTTNFVQADATLYALKNNTSNELDLSSLLSSNPIYVPAQVKTSIDASNQCTFEFTGLSDLLRGTGLYVSVTLTSSGSNSSSYTTAATDSSANPVYTYATPGTSAYSAGDASFNITSNGYTVVSVLAVSTTSGDIALSPVYLGANPNANNLTNNNPYNIEFTDPANANTYAEQDIVVSGIGTDKETLLIHVNGVVSAITSTLLVRGESLVNNL